MFDIVPSVNSGNDRGHTQAVLNALARLDDAVGLALDGLAEAVEGLPDASIDLGDGNEDEALEDEDPVVIALLDLQSALERAMAALRQALLARTEGAP
jgi:hypothetical protein